MVADPIVSLFRAAAVHLHLVLDNLNTHTEKSLRKVWGQKRADQFFARVTLHYTPTHASWLNMAEIEISCLKTQGLKARLATPEELHRTTQGIVAWRNRHRRKITWKFITKKPRRNFLSCMLVLGIKVEWY